MLNIWSWYQERDCAKHGFILLNESGYVKYKEIIDQDVRLNLDEALANVKKNILFAQIKGETPLTWTLGSISWKLEVVVYFHQLLGAARTQKLV